MSKQFAAAWLLAVTGIASAAEVPDVRGQFRWASTAIRFDVSPPLRDIPVIPPPDPNRAWFGALMIDPAPDKRWHYTPNDDRDATVQSWSGPPLAIPTPSQSFNAGTGTLNPPDPVGDVGPNHYVRMANSSFQIFTKTGTSVFGPANINTLFAGFGGDCQIENAGDPIVLYDQLADRWLLSQFSNNVGPGFFNCVALSTTSDPTGTYFRWAFPTGTFPDYPKYAVWPNAYVITTRELQAVPTSSIGVYAIDRQQMIAGNPTPVVISFLNPLSPGVAQFVGDGLLPADLDGSALPPPNSPIYLIGSMDDAGPYGAEEDALSLWRFTPNFANPPSSTNVLASVIPIAPYDTIFPCVGRSCITQPNGLAVDILSYRQRPTNRAAYRNFGSYESIVTTQSVEAAPGIAGMRWWEIRNPNGANPLLYQDATYAPGVTDTVQRWMGSIAQDRNGNMALGYSVTNSTNVFPGVRYTGRLERDPLGTMPQGEGEIVAGGGSFSNAGDRRWGDYTSMNVDSTDDCTFWYVNEYFAATGVLWTLRVGSFKFPECGQPDFGVAAVPLRQQVCAPAPVVVNVDAHGYSGFAGSASLGVSGTPAGSIATFAPPLIPAVPGSSTLTLTTAGATAGSYTLTISGTSPQPATRTRTVDLDLFSSTPGAASPTAPADDAVRTSLAPLLTWAAAPQGVSYVVEVATDTAFTNIVYTSSSTTALSNRVPAQLLAFDTEYFWRVRATNTCGEGVNSAVFSFRTRAAPGVCTIPGQSIVPVFSDNMENGVNGWTTPTGTGPLWVQNSVRPASGLRSWFAQGLATTSDQRLVSPAIAVPAALNTVSLRFQHDVTMEEDGATRCYDGGYVEVSTNGGSTFTPILAGDVLQDAYTGPNGAGQTMWCGNFRYRTASLDLSPYAGQTIQLRFRAETDGGVGTLPDGWYVDDVRVEGCGVSDTMLRDGFE